MFLLNLMSMTNERKLLLKCVTDPKALQSQWGQTIFEIEIEKEIKFDFFFYLAHFFTKYLVRQSTTYLNTENLR